MSTKIFNGYHFQGTIEEAYEEFLKIRPRVLEFAHKRTVSIMARHLAHTYDTACMKGETVRGLMVGSLDHIWDRQRKIVATRQRDPEVDFETSVVLYPVPILVDKHKGLLARFFTEHEEITDLWEGIPKVHAYPYWNNTDRPEELTKRQWDQRARTWEKTLDRGPGMIFEFCGNFYDNSLPVPMKDEVIAAFPSFDDRVDLIIDNLAVDEKFPSGTIKGEHVVSTLMDWYQSEERKEAIARIRPRVEKTLTLKIPKEVIL